MNREPQWRVRTTGEARRKRWHVFNGAEKKVTLPTRARALRYIERKTRAAHTPRVEGT